MSKKWNTLRGDDLTVFAASKAAQSASADFYLYLSKHASAQAVRGFINAAPDPLGKCFDLIPFCPSIAHTWLIETLNNAPSATTNSKIALYALTDMHSYPDNGVDSTLLLSHIDFSNIPSEMCHTVFCSLVHAGAFDILRAHWGTYKSAVEGDLEDSVMYAAERGLDIRTRVQWSPTTNQQREQYFTACCNGGLLERAKECNISPNKKKLLRDTLFLTCHRNRFADEVLHYLLDEYPQSQWHREKWILTATPNLSPPVRQKIMQHFKHHAPTFFAATVVQMASNAVEQKLPDLFEEVFADVPAGEHHKLMRAAALHKNRKLFKRLLKLPNGYNTLSTTLDGLATPQQQWVDRVVAETQNATLRSEVKGAGVKTHRRKL